MAPIGLVLVACGPEADPDSLEPPIGERIVRVSVGGLCDTHCYTDELYRDAHRIELRATEWGTHAVYRNFGSLSPDTATRLTQLMAAAAQATDEELESESVCHDGPTITVVVEHGETPREISYMWPCVPDVLGDLHVLVDDLIDGLVCCEASDAGTPDPDCELAREDDPWGFCSG